MTGSTVRGEESRLSQVRAVDRATAILYLLAERGDLGVAEVAAELGVHRSTAFRLMCTLENGHLIDQGGGRGKYRLGPGILRLAAATAGRLELPAESRPVCRRLAAELGEAVHLAILDGGQAAIVVHEYGTSRIVGRNWIGQRLPLHATASGKVLLAHADEAVPEELPGYTPHTITTAERLEAELRGVRERGWASTAEEFEIGLDAVAAPVRDATGDVVAALGVSGPSYRLAVGSFPALAARLLAGAGEIGAGLGWFSREPGEVREPLRRG